MFEAGLETLGTMTESDRQRWQEIVVHPYRKEVPDELLSVGLAASDHGYRSAAFGDVNVLHEKLLTNVPEPETW